MSTHDYVIDNAAGATVRADINSVLAAILSNNSSATEPTTTAAYMLWVDTTNNVIKLRNSADSGWITLPISITTDNSVDVNAGTVNGITSLSFSSGETVTTILDEDNLSSDSAAALATQQSIKAYVDSQVTAQDLDFAADTGGTLSIDLDSETFTIAGGTGVDTSGALNTLTIAIDSTVVTKTDTQTLTNKTIDADNNTLSNIEVDNLKSGVLDTDITSVSGSDDTLASAKAIKTYVDSQVTAQDLDFQADTGGALSIDLDSETLTVSGGTGVDTSGSGNAITVAIGQDVGTTQDVTFNTVTADIIGDIRGATEFQAKAGEALSKGDAVYISGISGNIPLVSKADADDSAKMPSFGLAKDDAALNATVNVTTFGTLSGLDTSAFSAGDTLFISTTAGALTASAPSGESSLIQNIGKVQRSHASAGSIKVGGAGRTNATPNLNNGKIFLGNSSNQSVSATLDTSVVPENTNLYHTTERVQDVVGGMVTGNTESGITVTYEDSDGTLDFVVGTLNQDTTGNAATATALETARTIHGVSFDGTANIDLSEQVQDTVGAMFTGNTETGITATYQDADGTIDLVVGTLNQDTTGNAATATALETARSIALSGDVTASGVNFDGTGNITLSTTIAANSVALGTDTTGNYVSTITGTTNEIEVSGSGSETAAVTIGLPNDVTIGNDLVVSGDLTVSGTTTTVNTETINLADNQIVLNSNFTGSTPTENGGIEIERGTQTNKTLVWNETDDKWTVGSETFVAGTFEGALSGNATTATTLATARTIGGVSFDGSANIDLAGVNTAGTQDTSGNAATATALATARTINGTSFDGSANISFDTDAVSEGSSNLYFTNARSRSAISATGDISYNSSTGVISFTQASAPVTSVNTQTGAVVLDTDDIAEGSTNLYISNERVQDIVGGMVTGNTESGITVEYQDADGTLDFTVGTLNQDTTGNAATATALETARTIHGVSFDGSANIDLSEEVQDTVGAMFTGNTETGITATYQDADGTIDLVVGTLNQDTTGNAATATALETARNFSITGDITAANVSFDGTGNVALSADIDANTVGITELNVSDGTNGQVLTTNGSGTLSFADASGGASAINDLSDGTTAGTRNTGLGTNALDDGSLTGTQNTAVGHSAATSNTSATNTNAFGYYALGNNTTGANNSAFGTEALAANTTGHSNNAFGKESLLANTTGVENVAIGTNSLRANTTASNNVAVGVEVLDANTTGTQNTAIGKASLSANTTGNYNVGCGAYTLQNATTASENTALGYRAGHAITTLGGNVCLGNYAGEATTGASNTFVGNQAGKNTTGSELTAVGGVALRANTTGTGNTACGKDSLRNNTTASNNTAVGYASLKANTTGTQNNAFGQASLTSCTTGNYNCAFGQASLNALTTGTDNCAFGDNALQFGTTGSANIGIGTNALRYCTTGGNIGIGYASGVSTTSGDASVTMGYEAGEDKTTGAHLTAIGYRAAMNATTGNYNTIMGSNSAPSMTTPNYNTLLGYNAGGGSYPLTTGSSCTMVGALARPSGTLGNANNENVFGFNMSASGAGTTTLGSGGSGLYATHGSTGWSAISDERYKKDIVDSEVGLSFINDLKVRNFKWKTCGEVPSNTPKYKEGSNELIHEKMTGVMHGFIAQEVKEVIDNHSEVPDNQLIWKQNPDGIQNLSKEELVPVLVKAVQELSAEVQQLKNKLQGE